MRPTSEPQKAVWKKIMKENSFVGYLAAFSAHRFLEKFGILFGNKKGGNIKRGS
jgi:hypothetical protein